MTPQRLICSSISSIFAKLAVALLLVLPALAAPARMQAQSKLFSVAKDSIPLFNGFSVSFDLIGAAMRVMSDYGEYEGALRLNLHNQYFPVVEVGYGSANHERDEVTGLSYKTQAPYFRLGCDLNLLKNKNTPNRLYGGLRYAFTSYKVDMSRPEIDDGGRELQPALDGNRVRTGCQTVGTATCRMGSTLQTAADPPGRGGRQRVVCAGLRSIRRHPHLGQLQCHHRHLSP